MITKEEQELIDKVSEVEDDFYAPLMAVCLFRYHALAIRGELGVSKTNQDEIAKLVTGVYKDLQNKFG